VLSQDGLWVNHVFRGYDTVTLMVVANMAFSGLLVSWVMKFADSIMKVRCGSKWFPVIVPIVWTMGFLRLLGCCAGICDICSNACDDGGVHRTLRAATDAADGTRDHHGQHLVGAVLCTAVRAGRDGGWLSDAASQSETTEMKCNCFSSPCPRQRHQLPKPHAKVANATSTTDRISSS